MSESSANSDSPRTLERVARRVLGVLVEKAKTTPDAYPMTVSALIAGCNQKSNRYPQMDLDEDDVTEALDRLRSLGAAREVQGSGRVNKYRHAAYEWLEVNAPQAAIMTELLLRGPQTAGELRARAARMEPFPDLNHVVTVLDDLQSKGLVMPLTPPGRGQQFAHTLYESQELDKLREKASHSDDSEPVTQRSAAPAVNQDALQELQDQVARLSKRLARLEKELGIDSE